ncbi:hypothetical protein [Corynebacterium pygosceleis]|uniref:Uncharacterized protein n=1 Tax=Corynebacterium pygosceleis TaxID=2800406 RepID=A0A9Q4C8S5_9CORY|nr:hypothetical protein [Corynebacterium pygosceleis]MCK7636955.1 hypothetical protein [Corynebacterium pygosceleis]MCK7674429.1 hypothetical protein [Corynebacterium pygosceleis]MCL0120273.1 hypothetical protein [Corynebacterium pygosceleis]MCX7467708.1 hypothetical protein [Corynebacterium pygosceleis]
MSRPVRTDGWRGTPGPWSRHLLVALLIPVGFLPVVLLSGLDPETRPFAELSYLTFGTVSLVVNAVIYARHLEILRMNRPPTWVTVTFACYHLAVLPLLIFAVVMMAGTVF